MFTKNFKPIQENEFSFLKASDNGRSVKIDFTVNGAYYHYLYNYGPGYGFAFICKYHSREGLYNQLSMAGGEEIYSSTSPAINTEEGVLIEYSLSKINLKQIARCGIYKPEKD